MKQLIFISLMETSVIKINLSRKQMEVNGVINMKKYKGLLSIATILAMSAVLWYTEKPLVNILSTERLSFIIGGMALAGFSLVFLLSTRLKWIEDWFNGLDNVYAYHKYLAIFSVAAVFVHGILAIVSGEEHTGSYVAAIGLFAFLIFVILTVIALVAKKIKYENWRFFHRLMVIPYGFGLYHTYLVEEYNLLKFTPLGFWVGITSVIGIISAIYIILFYQRIQFHHKGKITSIDYLTATVIELELTLDKPLAFENGQYLFLKVFESGFEKAPHPFSISGGDGTKIYLTIKTLGDFTKQLYSGIKLGTKISVEGPYGHMIFNRGKEEQIWVAGGIGIAPFMSYLRSNHVKEKIILYYSYRGVNEAVYKDLLEDYAKKNLNFKVEFNDTSVKQRLDFNTLELKDDNTVFMCGPVKMIKKYAKQLRKNNKNTEIVYEAFDFR
jgi:predicted ferric reductase